MRCFALGSSHWRWNSQRTTVPKWHWSDFIELVCSLMTKRIRKCLAGHAGWLRCKKKDDRQRKHHSLWQNHAKGFYSRSKLWICWLFWYLLCLCSVCRPRSRTTQSVQGIPDRYRRHINSISTAVWHSSWAHHSLSFSSSHLSAVKRSRHHCLVRDLELDALGWDPQIHRERPHSVRCFSDVGISPQVKGEKKWSKEATNTHLVSKELSKSSIKKQSS